MYHCTTSFKLTIHIECRTGVIEILKPLQNDIVGRNCTTGWYFKIKMEFPINGGHVIDIFKKCLHDKHVVLSRVYVFTVNIFPFNGNTIRSASLFYNKYYLGTSQIKIIR